MRAVLLATSVALLAACTTQTRSPEAAVPAPTQTATESPATTEPLVLAVPVDRPAPRFSLRQARRIADGKVPAPPGLRVVPASRLGPRWRTATVAGVDPIRRPSAYPLRTPGPTPPRPTTLTVVGDIMLARGVTDPLGALRPFQRRLASADLTIGNLESTLSRAGPAQQGGDSFGASPSVLAGLARAGFDAVSLANNHSGDYGERALLETVAELAEGPVRGFGAGADLGAAGRAFVAEAGGVRFGVLGFNAIGETPRATDRSPGALSVRMPPRTGPLSQADLAHVVRLVRRLDRRVDVVLVLPHWGTQYTHVAEPVQRLVARRLVDAGADLVVGGHPHWVQGVETYRGAVVLHSLGNFVFDMDFMTETMQGVVLEATYWGPELKRIDLVPYVMDSRFAPRPARGAVAADILDDVWRHSTVNAARR